MAAAPPELRAESGGGTCEFVGALSEVVSACKSIIVVPSRAGIRSAF